MLDTYYTILDFLYEADWGRIFFWTKLVSGFLSITFLIGIVYLVLKINLLGQAALFVSEAVNTSTIPKRRLVKKWDGIKKKFELGDDANLRLAVIDADKLFDELLMRMGYQGKTMGERLEKITAGQFPRIQEIWDAHKIRNNIVHDTDYQLTREDAEVVLKTYGAVLEDLEVI